MTPTTDGTPPYKALTLHQPWASLIALGVKRIETRSWKTDYRGRLAIHAGLRVPTPERGPMFVGDFHVAQGGTWMHGPNVDAPMPLGAIVATARLDYVVPTEDVFFDATGGSKWIALASPSRVSVHSQGANEAYGDFTPGRYAWLLDDIQPCAPIPAKGRQGLWNWTPA